MKVLEDGTVTMTFNEYDSHVEDAQEAERSEQISPARNA